MKMMTDLRLDRRCPPAPGRICQRALLVKADASAQRSLFFQGSGECAARAQSVLPGFGDAVASPSTKAPSSGSGRKASM